MKPGLNINDMPKETVTDNAELIAAQAKRIYQLECDVTDLRTELKRTIGTLEALTIILEANPHE